MAQNIAAPQNPTEKLRAAIKAAMAANTTFLGIATPTTAQAVAQVQRLTRQNNNIIRMLAGILDGSTD